MIDRRQIECFGFIPCLYSCHSLCIPLLAAQSDFSAFIKNYQSRNEHAFTAEERSALQESVYGQVDCVVERSVVRRAGNCEL